MIAFEELNHKYVSINPSETLDWISATTLIAKFKQPFDGKKTSERSSKNPKSKWYGMAPERIREIWAAEANRATTLGTWYHLMREQTLLECKYIERHGKQLPVIKSITDSLGRKIAPSQKLNDGIYPEHMMYLKTESVCGQGDLVEVANGIVDIADYKTNKEIKLESYVNWEGISQKMRYVLSHMDDCNANHYALQLSLYMYMVLKHNPKLRPGKLTIHHVTFEEEDKKDKYGYPLIRYDADNNPIVKDITFYNVPYLKLEVARMLQYYNANKTSMK